MADNLKKTRPEDASKINLNQEYEVNWWTEQLGVSEDKLKNAVKNAGVKAEDVRSWLDKN